MSDLADNPTPIGELLAQLRCLEGRAYTQEPLVGGLTNTNYKVVAGTDRYVVRVGTHHAGLLSIDRDHEFHNSTAAAAAGVGAGVVEYRPDLGVLVVEFLDGRTCSSADLRDAERLRRLALACRRLHSGPRFVNDFDMLAVQARYRVLVRQHGFRVPKRYDEFTPYLGRIRAALEATDEGTVPCHNDLLAANCLDDGVAIRLIDYEYAGNNDPCFELGNLWTESALDLEHLEVLIDAYYGAPLPQKVARARVQALLCQYGWTLWASIQDGVADGDFDFWAWGMEKYERAVLGFTSEAFDSLLDLAAGRRS